MNETSVEQVSAERPDSVHAGGLVITEELIHQRFGMTLQMQFPNIEMNGAGIVDHGEELERIARICGFGNVLASLYFDSGNLHLGIFVREGSIPQSAIDASSSARQFPALEVEASIPPFPDVQRTMRY